MKLFLLFILILELFIFSACTLEKTDITNQDQIVQLGHQTIGKAELLTFSKILDLNTTEKYSKSTALYKLTKTILLDSISKKYSYILKDTFLTLEAARIDKSTLRPETIVSIKEICRDIETYEQLYIKESLYPRWLHEQFRWDQNMQSEQGDLSKKLFEQVTNQAQLFKRDSLNGFPIYTFDLSAAGLEFIEKEKKEPLSEKEQGGKIIDQSKKQDATVEAQAQSQMTAKADLIKRQYLTAINGLTPGAFHPQPLQTADDFKILQFIKQNGNKSRIKMLSIPKRNYNKWLNAEMKKISLTIYDKRTWDNMLEVMPTTKKRFTFLAK